MHLILLAAAAWSLALGVRQCLALSMAAARSSDTETLAAWVSALSLIGAGLWAWQARSWLALLVGYLVGWLVLWMLPVHDVARSSRRTA